jgi:tetratricopeptide (TPR) repeat protein
MGRPDTLEKALVCATLVAAVAWPQASYAQEPEEAGGDPVAPAEGESAYDGLVELAGEEFNKQNYDLALDALERAYAIKPEANLLYNMARIKEAQGDLKGALVLYERFAVAPNVDLEYRKETLARIKVLKEAVALTEPKPEPEPDPEPVEKGDEKAELEPLPEVDAGPNPFGVVLTVAGGAMLAGGGIVGLIVSSEHNTMRDAPTLAERRQSAQRVDDLAPLADGLMVGGAAVLLGGIVTLALSGPKDTKVTLTTSGTGATVRWTF